MVNFYKKLIKFLNSRSFFLVVLLVFLLSAGWLAISSRYPMAFDEDYHLGLIKLHSLQANPIFSHQPGGVAQYGALTRDPSYLYHYLMSFPYRWLISANVSFTTMVVCLRFINIALFLASLVVFRRLLLRTRASPAIVHSAMLFFVLTPVVPLLAAHINYDNLQNLLIALALLMAIRFKRSLASKNVDIMSLFLALSLCLLGSLVKFTFLPILTAITMYIAYLLLMPGRGGQNLKKALKSFRQQNSKLQKIILPLLLLLSTALFINTYGVNIIKYHNPVPQCGQVLDVARCSAYPPWYRNYLANQNKQNVNPNPLPFTVSWFGGMFDRLFFTINGHGKTSDNTNYLAPIMSVTAILITLYGLWLLCLYGRSLIKNDSTMLFLLFVTIVYVASVWGRNYHDYLNLGRMVAINGRYLVPILLPLYVLIAEAYQHQMLRQLKAKILVLSISFLMFTQGGGAVSFIYYSNSNWYWPGNKFVNNMNKNAKRIVEPLFIAKHFPYKRS